MFQDIMALGLLQSKEVFEKTRKPLLKLVKWHLKLILTEHMEVGEFETIPETH